MGTSSRRPFITLQQEKELFDKTCAGGLPRSFSAEWWLLAKKHNLYVLQEDFARREVLLGTKKWIWLKPILKCQRWLVNEWFYGCCKVIRFFESHGWMEVDASVMMRPSTVFQWFYNSPKMKKVRSWMKSKLQ